MFLEQVARLMNYSRGTDFEVRIREMATAKPQISILDNLNNFNGYKQ